MRGKTNEEILAVREAAIEAAKREIGDEIEVIDSFFQNVPEVDNKPLWCLGESLKMMSEADVVYFCKDWERYRGCKIENICAVSYGIPLVIEEYK